MNNLIHTATVLVLTAAVAVGAYNLRSLGKALDGWTEVQRDALKSLTRIEEQLRKLERERGF